MFEIFYKALKGKQVLVFSGLFKDAHTLYKHGKLDVYKKKDEIKYIYIVYYNWCKKHYEKTRMRELTEDEKEELNQDLIDEIEID